MLKFINNLKFVFKAALLIAGFLNGFEHVVIGSVVMFVIILPAYDYILKNGYQTN